ncbi:MAG: hypothetical protein KJN93_02980, partial [Alphaproteobacteria bacterium]|nr:hypothetical protein [Alphaproteobacteria bacterium]
MHAYPRAAAHRASQHRASLGRAAFAFCLSAALLGALWHRSAEVDAAAIQSAFAAVRPSQWALAAVFTAISFWALGQYDIVIHRHLATGIGARRAARSGLCGIALSQTLGLGVLTGALVRWRLLPGLSLVQAAMISGAVASSFVVAWALLVAAQWLFALPGLPPALAALSVTFGLAVLLAALMRWPALSLAGRRLRLPSVPAAAAILLLVVLDTAAAAAAFWMLLPPGSGIGFAAIWAAYTLALGAGMLSGAPGGVGGFELALLALLPQIGAPELFGAILAFRLIY